MRIIELRWSFWSRVLCKYRWSINIPPFVHIKETSISRLVHSSLQSDTRKSSPFYTTSPLPAYDHHPTQHQHHQKLTKDNGNHKLEKLKTELWGVTQSGTSKSRTHHSWPLVSTYREACLVMCAIPSAFHCVPSYILSSSIVPPSLPRCQHQRHVRSTHIVSTQHFAGVQHRTLAHIEWASQSNAFLTLRPSREQRWRCMTDAHFARYEKSIEDSGGGERLVYIRAPMNFSDQRTHIMKCFLEFSINVYSE